MTELRVRRRNAASTDPVTDTNPLPVSVIDTAKEGADYTDFESITVSTTVKTLGKVGSGHTSAFITVATASIRFRVDATINPTATVGHLLGTGDTLELDSHAQLVNFKAIRSGGTDATLSVSYGA